MPDKCSTEHELRSDVVRSVVILVIALVLAVIYLAITVGVMEVLA
jgi:hypothetical protein